MNMFKLIFPALCVLSLTACSGTLDKMGYIPPSSKHVGKEQPNVTDKKAIFPEGYYGQNKHGIVLKPPGLAQQQGAGAPQATVSSVDVIWNQIDNYDPNNFTLQKDPQRDALSDLAPIGTPQEILPQGQRYNDAVQVFSLEGGSGISGYATAETDDGTMAQQVFFNHGSAAIKSDDKKKLHALAKRTGKKSKSTRVTVVGHASSRVHRVRDPIKKKMINFKMAQKRANAVTKELHKAGLKPAWVQAVSKGDEEPNPNPGSMPQEAADRRAEVYMEER